MKSYGWHSRGWSRDDSWGPRHTLDRQDIEKPETYGGDITKWLQWSGTFTRYLRRQDERWPQILKKIEAQKGQVIAKEEEEEERLAYEFGLWDVNAWKEQLMQCLENFTTGDAKRHVTSADECNVFSTWSRMSDKGHSLREEHVMDMRRKAYAIKTGVPAKDFEMAITLRAVRGGLQRSLPAEAQDNDPHGHVPAGPAPAHQGLRARALQHLRGYQS